MPIEVNYLKSADLIAAARGIASASSIYRAMRDMARLRVGRKIQVMPVDECRRVLGDFITDLAIEHARSRVQAAA